MLERMTADQTKRMMLAVCDRIIAEKPCLTRLDSPIGDADHGIGMMRGMMAAGKKLEETETYSDINAIFKDVGRSMISTMGGSSGVVFGTMFAGAAKSMPPAKDLTGVLFAKMMENSLREVQKRGKARPGDKTMVDALAPAVAAMTERVKEAKGKGKWPDLLSLFSLAAEKAGEGAEASREMIAKHGHSKTLGRRALGHPDPGAVSVFFIFDAMFRETEKIAKEMGPGGDICMDESRERNPDGEGLVIYERKVWA